MSCATRRFRLAGGVLGHRAVGMELADRASGSAYVEVWRGYAACATTADESAPRRLPRHPVSAGAPAAVQEASRAQITAQQLSTCQRRQTSALLGWERTPGTSVDSVTNRFCCMERTPARWLAYGHRVRAAGWRLDPVHPLHRVLRCTIPRTWTLHRCVTVPRTRTDSAIRGEIANDSGRSILPQRVRHSTACIRSTCGTRSQQPSNTAATSCGSGRSRERCTAGLPRCLNPCRRPRDGGIDSRRTHVDQLSAYPAAGPVLTSHEDGRAVRRMGWARSAPVGALRAFVQMVGVKNVTRKELS